MQRRHLFLTLSRFAAVLAWQQVFAASAQTLRQPDESWVIDDDPFPLGVASGEPTPESVVLWTRLAPRPLQADGGMPAAAVPVRWELAADARFSQVLRQGVAVADPASAHSVHVLAEGLAPGRTYHYRFEAGGQRSPVGRTRTAPDPKEPVKHLRMALASCQHYEHGYFTAHREIATSDIDVVLFVGDYIYTTRAPNHLKVRAHLDSMNTEPSRRSLAEYRMRHASYKLDDDLRASHAMHPWLMVWDDHEFIPDYARDSAPAFQDRKAYIAVRTAAYRAYFEHMPVSPRRVPFSVSMPMQGRYRWGKLADIWTLDTRQHRDAAPCSEWPQSIMGGKALRECDGIAANDRTLLGREQEDWLAAGLAGSDATWKFIAQTTQIAPWPIRAPSAPLLYADGWDAFPTARRRMMEAIAQPRVQDVVFLGGDVHRHVAANLRLDPLDPSSPVIASEVVATSITSQGMSELANGWIKAGNPDLLHMRSDQRGHVLIDVKPHEVRCIYRGTPHPVRLNSKMRTQATYVIERGRPGLRKA
jgi:alkaline phosphatase D